MDPNPEAKQPPRGSKQPHCQSAGAINRAAQRDKTRKPAESAEVFAIQHNTIVSTCYSRNLKTFAGSYHCRVFYANQRAVKAAALIVG